MINTINTASQFRDEFAHMGRTNQFSYEALGLLFDYLEECDPDYNLDVIGICCDYAEDTAQSIAESYGIDTAGLDVEELNDVVQDYLNEHTQLVGQTEAGTFVYCSSF
jgi:hypothetical protein